jgi:hypothetical protein
MEYMNNWNYISNQFRLPLGREDCGNKKARRWLDLRRARGWVGRPSFLFDSHAA